MKIHAAVPIALAIGLFSLRAMGAEVVDAHISAKNLTPDEAAVWTVIDREWGRNGCCGHQDVVSNGRYLDDYTDDAICWYYGAAGPITKAAMKMWTEATEVPNGGRHEAFHSTRIAYELYPQGLVIHGNTAVAHYRFRVVSVNKDNPNKADVGQGRFSDVLVRDNPKAPWKFVSFVGGE
jgi:hypothetical protein